ncbi:MULTISPECIES: BTAD domain-containing putative transcriptional regulator [Nocardia]|uniref:BTAD domain-containing putative transcriptional regulator n=1 Tax=Nocardia implantans TaxID=3108168 RepID=A0ABU6B4M3_9NOCA|nr:MULTISPECIES: BTAD domain-containing putative transcriptional regulator [unclassified Nocardia]MEA3532564.1 BTAD domain-containing putative transcriptional regulator [Nocardia sp. CDC192]MEB3514403.1 BTAD domain-containing putative transcriptional regulator [Nocardia sp. CDC186]
MTTPAGESVVVALLGEVALRRDGLLTPLPGARSRLLLTALALRPGRSRGAQALIEEVWGEQPPRSPMNALHTQVSRLRSALPEGALEIGPAGYRLTLGADQVDLSSVGERVARARELHAAGDLPGCLARIAEARALWRGDPGADLPPGDLSDELRAAAGRRLAELDELELTAREDGGDIDGALGLARLRAAAEPLDEPAQQTLMRLLAAAGRPNEAVESFAAFRSRLAEELGTDPGPALTEIHTAILRGERVGRAAQRSGNSATDDGLRAQDVPQTPHLAAIGLRAAPNALLGRAADITALTELLRDARVVTVLGPGGAGKTRVANEIGWQAAATCPVALVELASVRADGDDARVEIEAAIAAVLGLSEVTFDTATLRSGQPVDLRRRLHDAVSARAMLLILDNCEHLIDAVAVVVADLIGAAPRLTVLTTSRSPLTITAETVYPLPPLTIHPAGSPATELFAARARAVRPGVRLDPDVVAQLCHTLDGLPLAIELAAARVRVMSVEEINERLADRFALLRHGDRSSPERHRTLHAVIDWSWNLLDTEQQATLRRLCRFPAGFTLSAAEAVAGGADVTDVAAAVDGLVNQSLLTVLDDETLGTRYRMLETVREYGEEQLTATAGEPETVDTRMMRWAKDYADDVAGRYMTGDQFHLALALAAELDNLLAALRCAIERRDAATAYTVFPVVGTLWLIRGSHSEVIAWAERVIELEVADFGQDGPRPDLVLVTYQMTLLHLAYTDGGTRELARLRQRVRRLLRSCSEVSETIRFVGRVVLTRADGRGLSRLLAEAVRSPDPETRASALLLRANIRENLGDVRGSTLDADKALHVLGRDNVWSVAMVSRHLGQVCGQVAQYAEAVTYYRRALEVLQRLGAYEDTVEIHSYLVGALVGAGELEQARRDLAIVFGTPDLDNASFGQNRLLSTVMQSSAEVALAEGDIAGGFARYERALELFGWPDNNFLNPGPGALMLAAAALDARVLHGAADRSAGLSAQLAEIAVPMMSQYRDLPQIGAVACAIGSYLIAVDRAAPVGLDMLILAPNVLCRQDYPSMRWQRHLDAAIAKLGAERVDEARRRLGHLRRTESADRIMRMLASLADAH